MANFYIKSITPDERKANVVFHIPIPNENNSATVDLQLAVSQSVGELNFTSQVPWLVQGEIDKLQAGSLYEYAETVTFPALATNGEKLTQLNDRYTILETSILGEIRKELKFWGKEVS